MSYPGRERQGGAVAVMVGLLSALVFFGMMGIAVDLSYLYTRKTELQNAADAAALSGAKELNHTAAGVTAAIAAAISTFGQNASSNLINGESINVGDIRFGSCANPNDRLPPRTPSCTFVDADSIGSDAAAASLSFIEVDTGAASAKPVFFMRVSGGANSASTLGYAVAGRFFSEITPIGVCAITSTKFDHYATTNELLEYGFRRGMAYDVMSLGPLGSNNLPYLVNPVDTDPATCTPSNSSANFTAPFVCMGISAVGQGISGANNAIGNTGLSTDIISALNSRFGLYAGAGWGSNKCDAQTAPPDRNIRQYCYNTNGNHCVGQPGAGWVPPVVGVHSSSYDLDPTGNLPDANWNINSSNNCQTVQLDPVSKKPLYVTNPSGTLLPGLPFAAAPTGNSCPAGPNNGVLWSYGPAYYYDAGSPTGAGTPFTAAEANAQSSMYNNSAVTMTYFGANYPASHPYFQTSGALFASGGAAGVANRRIINLLIIDCPNVSGSGACGQTLPILGIGRFFMPVLADPTGSKKIEAEFAGLRTAVPLAEIKLYR